MQDTTEHQEHAEGTSLLTGFRRWFHKSKAVLGLTLLILYLLLLGLGTVGEVWEIEWILDLPLFRPPGKY